jgi:hypothetical protein
VQRADGHQVVGREDAVEFRLAFEQFAHAAFAAVLGEVADGEGHVGDALPCHGVAEPVEAGPSGVQGEGSGDGRGAAAALLEQAFGGEPAAVLVGEVDVAHRQGAFRAGEEDGGQFGPDEQRGQRVGRVDGHDEGAVGRALAQLVEDLGAGGLVLGEHQQRVEALRAQEAEDAGDDAAEEGVAEDAVGVPAGNDGLGAVGDDRHDERDHPAAAGDQLPGGAVGNVADGDDRVLHEALQFGGDVRRAVDDAGDRGTGDAGRLGDVLQRGKHGAACVADGHEPVVSQSARALSRGPCGRDPARSA